MVRHNRSHYVNSSGTRCLRVNWPLVTLRPRYIMFLFEKLRCAVEIFIWSDAVDFLTKSLSMPYFGDQSTVGCSVVLKWVSRWECRTRWSKHSGPVVLKWLSHWECRTRWSKHSGPVVLKWLSRWECRTRWSKHNGPVVLKWLSRWECRTLWSKYSVIKAQWVCRL